MTPFHLAIAGSGPAAWALATSTLRAAKARGHAVSVTVYAADARRAVLPPALLTPECRARLSALGAPPSLAWRAGAVRVIEVVSGRQVERLAVPSGGHWVLAGTHGGLAVVTGALAASARAQGARRIARAVDRVEPAAQVDTAVGAGEWTVWAQGAAQRFHAVALAGGARQGLGDRFFPGFEAAPHLPAVHAWLTGALAGDHTLRLVLSPCPGVAGLYLLPVGGRTYALAYGPGVDTAGFCTALMVSGREGYLPDRWHLEAVEATRVPNGAGRRVMDRDRVAVGSVAAGHPLQLGVSETLAAVRGAAMAFAGARPHEERAPELQRCAGKTGREAHTAASAAQWLIRAGERGPGALARAHAESAYVAPFGGGVLGLPSPTPAQLLGEARRAGATEWLARLFFEKPPAFPRPSRQVDAFYVVDDDVDSLQAVCAALQLRGARVRAFSDELSLFRALERRRPRALLLDVVLQWVDGIRLCEQIKARDTTRNIPVFVMSGLDHPRLRERASAAGADHFFSKPLDFAGLWQRLDRLPACDAPLGPQMLPPLSFSSG